MSNHKQLSTFFNRVVGTLKREYVSFHWPAAVCFADLCTKHAVKPIGLGVVNGTCNWRSLRILAFEFFNHAPEVSAIWESDAMRAGFDPDLLHEIMLGIFIGGDGVFTLSPADEFHKNREAMTAAMIAANAARKVKTP